LLAAGRKQWRAGERVRFYRSQQGIPIWLPDEADDASPISDEEDAAEVEESEASLFSAASAPSLTDRRDYDIEHYLHILRDSYAERLRVVFEAEDFSQLFRLDGQQGMFDRPIKQMHLHWIRGPAPKAKE
jgi:DNA polymerase I